MKRPPLLLLAFFGCKEPTQVVVEAYTNVEYRAGLVTAFTVGKPTETERAEPTTETTAPWTSSFVGSLVVVPGTADDATLSVKLVMGIDQGTHECRAPDYKGCIVARRRLRYSPHERIRLPITLYAECKDVPCDEQSTCSVLGKCVPVETTCTGETCLAPGEKDPGAPDAPPLLDAAADGAGPKDAAADAADAGADAPDDAPPLPNEGGTPGFIKCPGANGGSGCTNGTTCCLDPTGGTVNECLSDNISCPVESGEVRIRCDGPEDCGGSPCCISQTSGDTYCALTPCKGGDVPLCESTGICTSGTCAQRALYDHYALCQ